MTSDCAPDSAQAACMAPLEVSARGSERTGSCVLLPGDNARTISVKVAASDAVAGLRFDPVAGTDKGIQLVVDADTDSVRLFDEAGAEVGCPLPEGDVCLSARIVGMEVRASVNGEPLGSAVAEKPDALNAYLVCTGPGGARFSDIHVEPLSACAD